MAPSPAAGTAYQHGFGGLLSKNNHSGVEEEAKENEKNLRLCMLIVQKLAFTNKAEQSQSRLCRGSEGWMLKARNPLSTS